MRPAAALNLPHTAAVGGAIAGDAPVKEQPINVPVKGPVTACERRTRSHQ